jgi:hypothetical protein
LACPIDSTAIATGAIPSFLQKPDIDNAGHHVGKKDVQQGTNSQRQ